MKNTQNQWKIQDEDGNEFIFDYWRGGFEITCADRYGTILAGTTCAKTGVRDLHKWLSDKIGENDGKRTNL